MEFSEDDLKEFKLEAVELLESAEKGLLALDNGGDFKANYDAIFRAFHSIKGAASMLSLTDLQAHMHSLESILTGQQASGAIQKSYIDFFLKGSDAALKMLSGQAVAFDCSPPGGVPTLVACPTADRVGASAGRVLIVDDEPEIVELLTGLLSSKGFETAGATEASQALELMASFAPGVVLTDISMPLMTGPRFLSAVRDKYPDVPVVFVSGNVSKEALMDAIPNDVFGVIEKPFKMEEILSMCERAIGTPRPVRLLGQSIKTLLGKFTDLDDYFKARGKEDERHAFQAKVVELLEGLGSLQRRLYSPGQ